MYDTTIRHIIKADMYDILIDITIYQGGPMLGLLQKKFEE